MNWGTHLRFHTTPHACMNQGRQNIFAQNLAACIRTPCRAKLNSGSNRRCSVASGTFSTSQEQHPSAFLHRQQHGALLPNRHTPDTRRPCGTVSAGQHLVFPVNISCFPQVNGFKLLVLIRPSSTCENMPMGSLLYGAVASSDAIVDTKTKVPGTGVYFILLLNIALFVLDHVCHFPWVSQLYLNHQRPHWWTFITNAFCHASW